MPLPAGANERIREIGQDLDLVAATLAKAHRGTEEAVIGLESERDALTRDRRGDGEALRTLFARPVGDEL